MSSSLVWAKIRLYLKKKKGRQAGKQAEEAFLTQEVQTGAARPDLAVAF